MRSICNSFIDEIIRKANLSDVVGRYIKVMKRGHSNSLALCPFHEDRNPSLIVNSTKGFYHCFSCKAGGDVISFVQEYLSISFVEAVEEIADILGVEVVYDDKTNNRVIFSTKKAYDILNKTQSIYMKNIAYAQTYLKNRNVSKSSAVTYGLGFANLSHLYNLREKPHLIDQYVKLGLYSPKSNSPYLTNRITFPLKNIKGQIIGFAGRAIYGDPKYLNTAESDFFQKRKYVYGLYEALQYGLKDQRVIRHTILVEGYLDVLALRQYGYDGVSCMGTAISEHQIRTILQHTKKLTICLDGDSAGREANKRVLSLIVPYLNENVDCLFCLLPDNEDPDSLLTQSHGLETFEKCLNSSLSLSEFLVQITLDKDLLKVIFKIEKIFENIEDCARKLAFIKILENHYGFHGLYNYLKHKESKKSINLQAIGLRIKPSDHQERSLADDHQHLTTTFDLRSMAIVVQFSQVVRRIIVDKDISFLPSKKIKLHKLLKVIQGLPEEHSFKELVDASVHVMNKDSIFHLASLALNLNQHNAEKECQHVLKKVMEVSMTNKLRFDRLIQFLPNLNGEKKHHLKLVVISRRFDLLALMF